MPVLPGLMALPPTNEKFTALPDNVRVIESDKTAFSAIGLAPEFRTCAITGTASMAAIKGSAAIGPSLVCSRIKRFFLEIESTKGEAVPTEGEKSRA